MLGNLGWPIPRRYFSGPSVTLLPVARDDFPSILPLSLPISLMFCFYSPPTSLSFPSQQGPKSAPATALSDTIQSTMSGFEIAGLVLGAIPLITKAFDDYRRVIASVEVWRHYEVEVSCLILNLNSEHHRLEMICGTYLSSLDPDTDIDSMRSDPFGPLWKDEVVQRKIKARLESSYGKFQLVMEEFRKAINFIKDKLGLDAQWKVRTCSYP